VKIGINDLHRWLRDGLDDPHRPELFARDYDRILRRTVTETNARLILVDPFYLSRDRDPQTLRGRLLRQLPRYRNVVAALARRYKARHVKLHDMFQSHLRRHGPDRFCPEPVHPNAAGHLYIAHEWLGAVKW